MNHEVVDKIIKPYFDDMFEGSEYRTSKIEGGLSVWRGFWVGDRLIIGTNTEDDGYMWYSDGTYFTNGAYLFSLSWPSFYDAMKRYLNKKYPDISIPKVA